MLCRFAGTGPHSAKQAAATCARRRGICGRRGDRRLRSIGEPRPLRNTHSEFTLCERNGHSARRFDWHSSIPSRPTRRLFSCREMPPLDRRTRAAVRGTCTFASRPPVPPPIRAGASKLENCCNSIVRVHRVVVNATYFASVRF